MQGPPLALPTCATTDFTAAHECANALNPKETRHVWTVRNPVRYIHETLRPAANAAVAITDTTDLVIMESTSAATPAITTESAHDGQVVTLVLITESSTGTYSMAGVFAAAGTGTLLFDAVNDLAVIMRVDGIWRIISLIGATHS
jgi:hypothetical protein